MNNKVLIEVARAECFYLGHIFYSLHSLSLANVELSSLEKELPADGLPF